MRAEKQNEKRASKEVVDSDETSQEIESFGSDKVSSRDLCVSSTSSCG